ncbi:MAG: DUF2461 domain-containing protein [Oscillospiraceae bacterium]|jgi:uncharacterized protein (DUF2461 family)|nr:DUF2461 domain-containing protein [Oscillospiraceae bacterium]
MSEPVYDGITPEALFLLAENKFRDSKAFYEENKAALNRLVVNPLRQIAGAMTGQLFALDAQMALDPVRMVSRIRRDTRFTKEKHFYRSNLWINFRRQSEEFQPCPYMWFEIRPEEDDWSCGVCVIYASPAYMRFFHERLLAAPEPFLAAVARAQSAGAQSEITAYKKDHCPDAPENLKPWLNAKGFCIIYRKPGLGVLQDDSILAALGEQYAAFAEMYRWLCASAEEYISDGAA